MRDLPILLIGAVLLLAAGCSQAINPNPPTAEDQVLSNPLQLTHGFLKAGEAYFSPDMQWIIFQATTKADEDYQMYVAKLKWREGKPSGLEMPHPISPAPSWNSCGYFSPDGESLIFASTALHPQKKEESGGYQRDRGNYKWNMPATAEIFRADGWRGAVEAAGPGGAVNLAKHPLTHNQDYDAECAFSPDGKWIVYASKVDGDLELFVMKSDGSRPTRLTNIKGYDGGPFFSPDGRRLVYRSDRKGNNLLQIFVADLVFDKNGDITGLRSEKQLTDDVNVNWGPYWHPDGRHIIWSTSVHGHANYELYLMREDGSRRTRVTFTNGFDGLPVFSPDGKWLMWTSNRGEGKTSQIWIAKFTKPEGS